jgi:hypothetical protein
MVSPGDALHAGVCVCLRQDCLPVGVRHSLPRPRHRQDLNPVLDAEGFATSGRSRLAPSVVRGRCRTADTSTAERSVRVCADRPPVDVGGPLGAHSSFPNTSCGLTSRTAHRMSRVHSRGEVSPRSQAEIACGVTVTPRSASRRTSSINVRSAAFLALRMRRPCDRRTSRASLAPIPGKTSTTTCCCQSIVAQRAVVVIRLTES